MMGFSNSDGGSLRPAGITSATARKRSAVSRLAASALLMLGGIAFAGAALAYTATVSPTPKAAAAAPRAHAAPARMGGPVVTVRRTAPGQEGYVHYFLITGPDGEPETQVGLELAGDRIAWSFPNMGVSVSPFVSSGEVSVNGAAYTIEHLYGIRPFRDQKSMTALRAELEARTAWWLDRKTPYCDEENPTEHDLCVSCLGFVLRVLYPGKSPELFALPNDFKGARADIYTTEDFLMYLAGVRLDAVRQDRLKRIRALKVPKSMREELVRIASAPATNESPRAARARPRTSGRALVQTPKRAPPRRGS